MSLESQIQDLVTQTDQLDNTITNELVDVNSDLTSLRSRMAAVEGALGAPELRSTGGGFTVPGDTIGNDTIKIDQTDELLWFWNPSTSTWVSIPFSAIAPPTLVDVQAIINQANTAIDAGIELRLAALAASITETVLETQQTQIDGLASSITTIGTTVSGNTSAIQTESTARASGDSALASQITDLVATVGANETAFLSFQAAVAADPTSASAQLLSTMQTQINNNTSAIQSESSTRSTQTTSLANQITTLSSSVGSAQSAIVAEATARANADSALTTTTQSLAAQLGTAQGAITNLQSVTSGLNSNTVSSITTLSSQVGSLNTTVQDVSTAVNGIKGKRSIAINANGQVTGIELLGGGASGSQIKFQAANLVVYDPSTGIETVPFSITGGATYIKKAVIKDSDIDTLKIAGNAVTVPLTASYFPNTAVTSSYSKLIGGTLVLNQPGWVYVIVTCGLGFPQGTSDSLFELWINGTKVSRMHTGSAYVQSVALSGAVYGSAGNNVIEFMAINYGGKTVYAESISLYAQGAMR